MLDNKIDIISITESAVSSSNLSTIKSKNYAYINFRVKYHTETGQNIYVLGNIKELGCWQLENGLKMYTDIKSYPFWFTTEEIKVNIGTEICYKYVMMNTNTKEIEWESNMTNRLFKVENKGVFEINEEKGNKKREIKTYNNKINLNLTSLNSKTIGTCSPIHDRNVYHIKDLTDNEIEIRGSITSSDNDENN